MRKETVSRLTGQVSWLIILSKDNRSGTPFAETLLLLLVSDSMIDPSRGGVETKAGLR
jgi:hypothetical protein